MDQKLAIKVDFSNVPLGYKGIARDGLVADGHVVIGHFDIQVSLYKQDASYRRGMANTSFKTTLADGLKDEVIRDEAVDTAYTIYTIYQRPSFFLEPLNGRCKDVDTVDAIFKKIGKENAALMCHVCWVNTEADVYRTEVQGKASMYLSPELWDYVDRILHHLQHLKLCEVWYWTCSGTRWWLPAELVLRGSPGKPLFPEPWERLSKIKFVAGTPGTKSAECSKEATREY